MKKEVVPSCGVPGCSVLERQTTGNHGRLACVAVGSTCQKNVDSPWQREETKMRRVCGGTKCHGSTINRTVSVSGEYWSG